jgi:large subunit ribosomal protein L10
MKSRSQKQKELEKGRGFLEQSKALIFIDTQGVGTKDFQGLKRSLGDAGAKVMVIKKRLLGLLMKEKKLPFESGAFKLPVATVFAEDLERASSLVHKFFSTFGGKDVSKEKILGGYDTQTGQLVTAEDVQFLGALPPREVLLGQLLGMIAAPIRGLLYVLQERSKGISE